MTAAPADGGSPHRVQDIYSAAAARAGATAAVHPLAAQLYQQRNLPGAGAASLGCADSAALACLQPGQTVLDLGCRIYPTARPTGLSVSGASHG